MKQLVHLLSIQEVWCVIPGLPTMESLSSEAVSALALHKRRWVFDPGISPSVMKQLVHLLSIQEVWSLIAGLPTMESLRNEAVSTLALHT